MREAGVSFDESLSGVQQLAGDQFLVREGIAERLVVAQQALPDGIVLQLKEGFRPVSVQQVLWDQCVARMVARYPGAGEQELADHASTFVAPPAPHPPHSTGGAVDVVLLREGEGALDMGSALNAFVELNETSAVVPEPAATHRTLLVAAMEAGDFVNYPAEWWHWSYGDPYWACATRSEVAPYGSVG